MQSKYYIISFLIGIVLITGYAIASDVLLSRTTATTIDNKNLLAIQKDANVTTINPTISNAECVDGKCKICVYQENIINDCLYIQEADTQIMRNTMDAWVQKRLNDYGDALVKRNSINKTVKSTGGDLSVNGR